MYPEDSIAAHSNGIGAGYAKQQFADRRPSTQNGPSSSASASWEGQLESIAKTLSMAQGTLESLDAEHFGMGGSCGNERLAEVPAGRAGRIGLLIATLSEQADRLRQSTASLASRV